MRERKHQVEVRDGKDVPDLLFQPLRAIDPLASWTVTIAA